MENTVYDNITLEVLAAHSTEFDTQTMKVRCVSCQREIETTLGELRQRFARGQTWWTMVKQGKLRIPFTHYEVIFSLFKTSEMKFQPKKFVR